MLAGLALGVCLYGASQKLGQSLIDRYYMNEEAVDGRCQRIINELQYYIHQNKLSSRSTDEIARWTIARQNVYVLFYQNQRLAFEAGWWGIENSTEPVTQADVENVRHTTTYPVDFTDGIFQAVVYDFSESGLYTLTTVISVAVGCISFAVLLFLYNRQVTHSIISVTREVRQIGEGDLHTPLTTRSNDELGVLSRSVESMRRSILQKTDEEQQALQQNSELITAMSHDIRNPLTALLGYLDLASSGQYSSQEELQQYVEASYKKAEQIRQLSDELLKYSLLFGQRELPLDLREYDAYILLTQLLGEQCAGLQGQGFLVQAVVTPLKCAVRVDVMYLKRVFDNLFDNVKKYADPELEVFVNVQKEGGEVRISVTNTVRSGGERVESNKIGLRTCEKILSQMGGRLVRSQSGGKFTAEARLPVSEADEKEQKP